MDPTPTYLFDYTRAGTDELFASASVTVAERVSGAVPEPATWAMMALGFGLAGAAVRRCKSGLLTSA